MPGWHNLVLRKPGTQYHKACSRKGF